jgi:hypothetical protein
MRMAPKLMLRFVGKAPFARRYMIERDDQRFWDGTGWVEDHGQALLYRTMREAQAACVALTRAATDGKPRREFRCTLTVNVVGENAGAVLLGDLIEYLQRSMLVSLDYETADGALVADAHVECRVGVGGLREVAGRKRGG